MTDQTTPDVTDDDRRRARECAEFIEADMSAWGDGIRALARVFLNAFPAPPRPTLADMTPEERHACRWMQADVKDRGVRYVIANPLDDENEVALIDPDGDICWLPPGRVTPRPDLPRLEWPGTGKPAPTVPEGWRLADHRTHGRVIVTTQTPDRDGYVYVVIPDAGNFRGYDWHFCDPDEMTYLDTDQGADTSDAAPPNTLAVGSEWNYADALARACRESERDQIVVLDRDGDAYIWPEAAEWWESVSPMSANAPFTIIHAGKKADQ